MPQVETLGNRTGQDYTLVALVERLDRHRAGKIAAHIHLSRLAPHHRREQYIRLAFSTFDNAASLRDGHSFLLRNNDFVFVGPTESARTVEEALVRLRYLFSEDALVQQDDDDARKGFCTWYALDRDYPRFLEQCRALQRRAMNPDLAVVHAERAPLDPASLAKVEEALVRADLSNLIRHQPICALNERLEPTILFREMYVSIADLEATLMPLTEFTANPWLFRYLTQCLDKRMLAHLTREWSHGGNFSINLNISTLLSPEFFRFDQQMSSATRGKLVVELQKVDIFEDMGAFLFAREYMKDRGYRLCLDGLTHLTLPFIDREKLGLDLVKLLWSPELAAADNAGHLDKLKAAVAAVDPARVILAHCDSEDAIKVGHSLGIRLFQGRLLSKMSAQHHGAR